MNEEERKALDKLLEIVDKLMKQVDENTGKTRANAYTVRLEDNYAITLRDNFNKLQGEWDALIKVKNEILKLLEEE